MVEAIEVHEAIEPLAAEWEELAERLGATPFLRPGWFSCWLDAFGAGRLRVVALRRDGALAAVMPTLCRRGAVRSPTNWHTPGYGPLAEDDQAAAVLLAELFRDRPRRVDLSFLTATDAARLREAAGRRRVVARVVQRSPYVSIEKDWDSFLGQLSRNFRGNLRRRRRRLDEQGEVEIEVRQGGDDLSGLLDRCFEMEAQGWKGERGTAILSTPQTRRFYAGVAGWAARQGLLRLCLLRLDGAPIAFVLGLESGGRHYDLKVGHDVGWANSSPGTVLTAAMVERCFKRGLASYEFLGAADPHKLRWTDSCREGWRVQAFAATPAGALDRLVQTRGRAAAKRLLARRRA